MLLESERADVVFVKETKCSRRFRGYYEQLWRGIMRTPALLKMPPTVRIAGGLSVWTSEMPAYAKGGWSASNI